MTANFTSLLTSSRNPAQLSSNPWVNITSVIGCSISIVSLVLCIACFVGIKALHSTRNTIHINLCVCLLAANVVMVISVVSEFERKDLPSENVIEICCVMVAVLLPYFYLASFMWMGIEGYHVYQSLVRIFKPFMPLACLYIISYGIPFFTVGAASLKIFLKSDGFREELNIYNCWIASSSPSYVWTLLTFAAVVLLFNVTVAVLALRSSLSRPETARTGLNVRGAKARRLLWQVIALHPLLGFPWIFEFILFSIPYNKLFIVLRCISTLLIALQGFFIFVFHCSQNPRVQSSLVYCLSCCKGSSMMQLSFVNRSTFKT